MTNTLFSYRGKEGLKKSGAKLNWTKELIAEYVKCRDDVVYFAEHYFKIVVEKGFELIKLRDYQIEMLKSMQENRFSLFCCARQSGKTEVFRIFITHYILFNEYKTVAILANKAETAREILSKLQLSYQNLPIWLQLAVKDFNKGTFTLENNSRIIATSTSKNSARGFTAHCVILDEAAFIENFDEFYSAVYPVISAGVETKIIMVSCVADDTYIFTDKGIKQVRDFIDKSKPENPNIGYEIENYSVEGKSGINHGNIMVNSGKAPTKIIISKSSEIECSYNHKLWACKNGIFDWFKSEELEEGDYISVKYGMNLWGNNDLIEFKNKNKKIWRDINYFQYPEKIDKNLSYFLGLYLAKGYTDSKRGRTIITCGDDISESITNIGLTFTKHDKVHYNISSKYFTEFLETLGFDTSKKAKEKTLPSKIMELSEYNICNFLSGYFDGDGCITQKGRITLTSTSVKMIKQIRMLLLNLGIRTQLYNRFTVPSKKVRVSSHVWILEICSYEDIKLFSEKIGFRLKRKSDRFIFNKPPSKNITKDIIPWGREYFKNKGFEIKETSDLKRIPHISRKKCLEIENLRQFDSILDEKICWEKIKKIENSENYVYDFSLNDIENDSWCHSVLYNGIVGHQTPNSLNHFYDFWQGAQAGTNGFNPIFVPWYRVPGRDEKWKKQTLEGINNDLEKFAVEFECSFIGSSSTLISGHKLKQLITMYKQPLVKDDNLKLNMYERPIGELVRMNDNVKEVLPPHKYFLIADVSRGKGSDYSAFSVIDCTELPYKQVCTFRDNEISPADYAEIIYKTATIYNAANVLVEINDIGEQIGYMLMMEFGYENVLCTETSSTKGKRITFGGKKADKGIRTTKFVKALGCSFLKLLIEQDKILIYDQETVNELTTFSKKKLSYEAEHGKHDDLVMGLVLFAWLTDQNYFKEFTEINTIMSFRENNEEDINNKLTPFGFIHGILGPPKKYKEYYEIHNMNIPFREFVEEVEIGRREIFDNVVWEYAEYNPRY